MVLRFLVCLLVACGVSVGGELDVHEPQAMLVYGKAWVEGMVSAKKEKLERRQVGIDRTREKDAERAATYQEKLDGELADLAAIEAAGLGEVRVYLYYSMDPPAMQAVIRVAAEKPSALLGHSGVQKGFAAETESFLKATLSPKRNLGEGAEEAYNPVKDWGMQLTGEAFLIGPSAWVKSADVEKLAVSSIAQMHGERHEDGRLWAVTGELPEEFGSPAVITQKVNVLVRSFFEKDDFGSSMMAGMVSGMVGAILEPLGDFEDVSVSKGLTDGQVVLEGQFHYRDAALGKKVYEELTAADNPLRFDWTYELREVVDGSAIVGSYGWENEVLQMKLAMAEDDKESAQAAKRAMSSIMRASRASSVEPQAWTLDAVYVDPQPVIVDTNLEETKALIKRHYEQETYHGRVLQHAFGNKVIREDRWQFNFEPLAGVPVQGYLNYRVDAILDAEGKDVLQGKSSSFFSVTEGGRGQTRLVPGGLPATIQIMLEPQLPETLGVFDLTAADLGAVKVVAGHAVKLNMLQDNAVAISYKGKGARAEIHPYDATGKVLERITIPGRGYSLYNGNFRGQIAGVRVVIAKRAEKQEIPITLKVTDGKGRWLDEAPTDTPMVRHRDESEFLALCAEARGANEMDLQAVAVTTEVRGKQFHSGLALPSATLVKKASIEYWMLDGEDLQHKSTFSMNRLVGTELQFHRNYLEDFQPKLIVGQLNLEIPGEITTLDISVDGSGDFTRELPNGQVVKAIVDKNFVIIKLEGKNIPYPERWDMYRYVALDGDGKALLYVDGWGAGNQRMQMYWGTPKTLRVLMQGPAVSHVQAFSWLGEGADQAEVERWRKQLTQWRKIALLARAAHSESMSFHYADDIAGHHFMDKSIRRRDPLAKALALSDPAGAERWGYQAKPLLGYHFSFATGQLKDDDTALDCFDTEKPATVTVGETSVTYNPLKVYGMPVIATPVDTSQHMIIVGSMGVVAIPYQKGLTTVPVELNKLPNAIHLGNLHNYPDPEVQALLK